MNRVPHTLLWWCSWELEEGVRQTLFSEAELWSSHRCLTSRFKLLDRINIYLSSSFYLSPSSFSLFTPSHLQSIYKHLSSMSFSQSTFQSHLGRVVDDAFWLTIILECLTTPNAATLWSRQALQHRIWDPMSDFYFALERSLTVFSDLSSAPSSLALRAVDLSSLLWSSSTLPHRISKNVSYCRLSSFLRCNNALCA